MKGIILTAGKGTRLYPLTKIMPKPLLPVYNRPMIDYPIETLTGLGVDEFLIIASDDGISPIKKYMEEEHKDIKCSYVVQATQDGIAGALRLADQFITDEDDNFYLILGDNIFENPQTKPVNNVCTIFTKDVPDPERFGVWDDKNSKIVEKPKEFISNKAVVGLYYLPPKAVTLTNRIKPSARGELEITDLINLIAEDEEMRLIEVDGDWVDAGTFDSLLEAANMVAKYE